MINLLPAAKRVNINVKSFKQQHSWPNYACKFATALGTSISCELDFCCSAYDCGSVQQIYFFSDIHHTYSAMTHSPTVIVN